MNTELHRAQAQELAEVLSAYPEGSDLLVSAFVCAAMHYRRATVCTPFPSELFRRGRSEEKDFHGLRTHLAKMPSLPLRPDAEALLRHPESLGLLSWLIAGRWRPRLARSDVAQVDKALQGASGWPPTQFSSSLRPQLVLSVQRPPRPERQGSRIPSGRRRIAFHGTSMENVHSILHNGLLNMSGTRLERTGTLFGPGIYLSTDMVVAFSFCSPQQAWPRSRIGSRMRCLLVCEVSEDDVHKVSDKSLPETYIVVDRPDLVRLSYVFVYSDGPPIGMRLRGVFQRWDICTVLLALYAAFMVLLGVWQASPRWLRNYLWH